MQLSDWRGVFPAVTTKFHPDFSLDFDVMASNLETQVAAGVHGIILLGSLGENPVLSAAEKGELVRLYSAHLQGRLPLVPCIAEAGLREAIELIRVSEAAGVDGFMVLPPMRYQPDRRETLAWFRAIAAATELPLMIYNNPVAYGTDVTPADFVELAEVANIVAIKESAADPRRVSEIRRLTGDRFALFCGVDDLALECFSVGAVGWVAGLVVAFPRETVRLYELMCAGEWQQARALYNWFLPLLHLDIGPRFVQQIKLVEELTGCGSARVRPPRLPLEGPDLERVGRIVKEALATRPDF